MKQVIQHFKTGELKVDEVPTPILKGKGVLVQNYYSVISAGTERSTVSVGQASLIGKAKQKPEQVKQVLETVKKEGLATTYQKVQNKLNTPKALGYSSAGRVIAVSDEITDISIGDMVACGGQDYASHAEVVYIPRHLVCKIPTDVSIEDASFATMGSIAMQGVRLCQPELGFKVAVIGMGLLGNLAVQMFAANGCEVIAIDVSGSALEGIEYFGASAKACIGKEDVVKSAENFSNGYGLDAVLITAGTSSNEPIELAGKITRKKGRVVVTGAVRMDIPREDFFKKEIEVVISSSYGPGRYDTTYEEQGIDYPYSYVRFTENRNMETFLRLLNSKKIRVDELITHRFPIENAVSAYDLVIGNSSEPFKAITLTYPQKKLSLNHQTVQISSLKTENKMGIGFIGAGSYAQSFLIPGVKKTDNHVFTGVCTSNGINAKSIAEKNGFSFSTTNQHEIITNPDTDVVFIATRHNSHAELVNQAVTHNKHVFVEKPLAMTETELDSLRATYFSLKNKPHVMVGFNRRYSVLSQKLKLFFKASKEPLLVNYRINAGFIAKDHWTQGLEGGGRIIGEVCHFIDYAKFMIESKVTSVYARSISSANSQITNEDNCIITLTYENGSIAVITYIANGDTSFGKERIEVSSNNQIAVLDDFKSLTVTQNGKSKTIKKIDKGQMSGVKEFLSSIKDETPLIPFEDLCETTKITFDIQNSIQQQRTVIY